MTLQEELDRIRAEIRTDAYAMSIGEWISLYEHQEVDIHPEFQRFFRWTSSQKTLFIESLLLGIPIPPIFVSQRDDGIWDVIDGLQRLSTIYQFFGSLTDENGKPLEPLVLDKTEMLPSLEGKRCHSDDSDQSLTSNQRLYIKRAKLPVSIILKESKEFAQYELFQRLNTGGSQLSDQEVRNCILVQQNRQFFDWIRELSLYDNFVECCSLSDRSKDEQYSLELVLRFLVFRTLEDSEIKKISDFSSFLTKKMIELATSSHFNYEEESYAFKQTFDILSQQAKENSFRRYDPVKKKFVGGFLLASYEIFGLGIGYNYSTLSRSNLHVEERIKQFWTEKHTELLPATVDKITALRTPRRLLTTLPFGRKWFAE